MTAPVPEDIGGIGHGGYVRLYRSVTENAAFSNGQEAMFFAYLILRANWKPGPRRYDGRIYNLDRGELVIGARKLADDYGVSHKRVRTMLGRLLDGNMIGMKWAQHGAQRAPIITICNYDKFQNGGESGAQPRAQEGHKGGTPYKEGKEGKEEDSSKEGAGRAYWNLTSEMRAVSGKPTKSVRACMGKLLKLCDGDFKEAACVVHRALIAKEPFDYLMATIAHKERGDTGMPPTARGHTEEREYLDSIYPMQLDPDEQAYIDSVRRKALDG